MSLEEAFEKFQKNFEEVTLTLIGQINKITDNLNRVVDNIQVIEELRIKSSENTQNLTGIEKNVKSLLLKLEKMSQGGFQIPELPEGASPIAAAAADTSMDALLNTPFTGPATALDDLDAEIESSSMKEELPPQIEEPPEEELPPPPIIEPIEEPEAELKEEPIEEPEEKPVPEMEPESVMEPEPVRAPKAKGWTQEESLTPIPKPPAGVAKALNISNEDLEDNSSEAEEGKIPNPSNPKEFLNNLMVDAQHMEAQKDLGDMMMATKEMLSKKIPFNIAYFEMVMMGGKLQMKKDAPITDAIRSECISKIKGWITKF